jgi:frataxin-like iron-binding protein CyaY
MGGACSAIGGEQECIKEYWWESQKEGNHFEDQDVGGWTILKWILER